MPRAEERRRGVAVLMDAQEFESLQVRLEIFEVSIALRSKLLQARACHIKRRKPGS